MKEHYLFVQSFQFIFVFGKMFEKKTMRFFSLSKIRPWFDFKTLDPDPHEMDADPRPCQHRVYTC